MNYYYIMFGGILMVNIDEIVVIIVMKYVGV